MKTINIRKLLVMFLLCLLCFCIGGCSKSDYEKAQKEAEKAAEAVESHEPTSNIFKAMFSKKYVMKSNYNKMLKKNNEAQSTLGKEEVKEKEKQKKSSKTKITIIIVLVVVIGGILFIKLYFVPYMHGRIAAKGVAETLSEVGVVPSGDPPESVQRTGRMSVDYNKLLQQDCTALDLDYNSVLADFNGNAEKAYETIHVQALQKQHN